MNKRFKVLHYPQIPCDPFEVEVDTIEKAKLLFDVLADYDAFQYKNKIKPDYSNVTLLEEFDEKEDDWVTWFNDEYGTDDIYEYYEYLGEKSE